MTFKGTVKSSGLVKLDEGSELPLGTRVNVQPVAIARGSRSNGSKPRDLSKHPFAQIAKLAVDTGLTDQAAEHDHYLYGTPKRARTKTKTANPRRRSKAK